MTKHHISGLLAQLFEIYQYYLVHDIFLQYELAETFIKSAVHYAKILLVNPHDYEARAGLTWIGSIGISSLQKYRKINQFTVQAIENELLAVYDIPHGALIPIIAIQWGRISLNEKNIDRYYKFGINVCDINKSKSKEQVAKDVIVKAERFFFDIMGMRKALKKYYIDERFFEDIADKAYYSMQKSNVKYWSNLSRKQIIDILHKSLEI